ncbi:type I polyketide synthase [Bacillus mycoides]|uniref:type I polyketide synthase n=1 Tax=Bacillus mycoides TaxID=1405 RepID=UPI0018CC9678|nr:type I polyketide synthase [Bacillus mycoides]MBG9687407.1 hypothetical protein [Bacillus mycoides]
MSNFDQSYESAIAIIGSTGRFPGAKDIPSFWNNIRNGVESITLHSDEELRAAGVLEEDLASSNYVKASAMLDDIDMFDADFFGYNQREAEMMDPQQRIFLEGAWEALENAGYDPKNYNGLIGVYAGTGLNTYAIYNLLSNKEIIRKVGEFQTMLGNEKDFLPMRASYKLDLKGPSVNVQTACSTSLVSVHMACQSLLNGECDMALAGGIAVKVTQGRGYPYQEGGIASPDGHCRAFDDNSQGTVFGSGMGIVVLKRLEDALEDGDCIQAIIRGSTINNDGDMKIGFTAPSVDGQAEAIMGALAVTDIHPETIGYIETHGTGTSLGDPIEIMGLTRAFQISTDQKQYCPIGSVKTNVGHLDAAAGVTGLIKVVESLKHKELPPSLHFEKPNSKIDFENSPFYVNTELKEWPRVDNPRRAGVSSFGVGGTNAHVIVEEAPELEPSDKSRVSQLFILSAKTKEALEATTNNLSKHLQNEKNINLADTAYTLQLGRREFEHRRMVVCSGRKDIIQVLEERDPKRVFTSKIEQVTQQPVVFMFPGQGAQYVDMGRELYKTEPVFRDEVNRCAEILNKHLDLDIRTLLYPNEKNAEQGTEKLKQTYITQPVVFVIEYALAKLWMSLGVKPHAMIGHSVGEYVAACLSGVFSLEDALVLIAARGKMIQQLPQGSMLAVPLSEQDILSWLGDELSLAAVNGPNLCVVSGRNEAIKALKERLAMGDIEAQILHTSHAFHSKMMDPILDSFTKLVQQIEKKAPNIPYISNYTGTWIQPEEAMNSKYWAQHLRQAVRFTKGIETLLEDDPVFLEVGPGHTLSMLVKQQKVDKHRVIISMRHVNDRKSNDTEVFMNAIGKLWMSGVSIDWKALYVNELRYRVPLPTYPFQRRSCWVEPKQLTITKQGEQKFLEKNNNFSEWFYRPVWKQSSLSFKAVETEKQTALVFIDKLGLHLSVIEQLQSKFKEVITVKAGEAFEKNGLCYTINPTERNDYRTLFQELQLKNKLPETILHMWGLKSKCDIQGRLADFERMQDLTFNSLLFLAQEVGDKITEDHVRLMVVTNNVQGILGDEVLYPEISTIGGPIRVIPQEYSNIDCCHIDFSILQSIDAQQQRLASQLVEEVCFSATDTIVAYRGNYRWSLTYDANPLEVTDVKSANLRKGGVYLLTGGLGGIGLAIAEELARTLQAKLVLVGRSCFPDKQEWEQWISEHDEDDRITKRIKQVQNLEKLGAEVLILKADVSDIKQIQSAIDEAERCFGSINGVFHLAAVPGAGLIQLKTPEMAANVLAPKVKGALVLDEVMKDKDLDFIVLFSSLASVYGGIGQVDYAAANSFLDALAHYHFANQNRFTVSVNWGQWQYDSWQDEVLKVGSELQKELRQKRELFGMTFKEGIHALLCALKSKQPQMVVTTQDLHTLISQHEELKNTNVLKQLEHLGIPKGTKVSRSSDNLFEPTNKIEEEVTVIWKELFGIDQISIHDDFFDLGGHSLLAVQLLFRLREVFKLELSLTKLFEVSTIASISDLITRMELESLEDGEWESLLVEIESLADEDIEDEIAAALNIVEQGGNDNE